MMKYYEMHEDAYKQLKAKDKISWDGETDAEKLLSHDINIAIDKKLAKSFPKIEGKKAVDLGTGTGTCALSLSKQGFSVRGFDISETAIGLARENAKKLGLNVEFEVADITSINISKKVDLVTDSSLLHCLVEEEDRGNFFKLASNLLNDDGFLFLHTMIEAENMSEMLDRDHLILEDHILYSTSPDRWDMDWQQIQGKRVFPHRMITTVPLLEAEIAKAGFKIVSSNLVAQEKSPNTLCAWLQKN